MRWKPAVRLICVLTAVVLSAVAQRASAEFVLPPLVVDPQQSMGASQQRPCRYTGDFRQERQLEELDAPLVSSGRFLFSCDYGLLWEVRKPIVDARVYSTQKLNFRIRSNKNVTQLGGIANSRTASLLLDLMSGNTAALSNDFTLSSDSKEPVFLVLRPKSRAVQKRLTQLIIQQHDDSVSITIQAPSSGDLIMVIDNVATFEDDGLRTCQQFSQQPSPNCSVLTQPREFVTTQTDATR